MVFKHCSINGQLYLNPMQAELATPMREGKASDPQVRNIDELLRLLVLCNDVIPQNNDKTAELENNSASPDEVALVQSAAQNEFELLSRCVTDVVVRERKGKQVT